MSTTKVPKIYCPFCNYLLNAASSPEDEEPSPGDLSVCVMCASALRFDENLNLKPMTQDEINKLEPDEREMLEEYQRRIRQLDRRGKT